jgi:hypothetical protein
MFGDRIGKLALRLAVPARHKGQAMGDIFNLNVNCRWVKQVQSPSRQHSLPSAWLFHGVLE